jgi:hypothetical protein
MDRMLAEHVSSTHALSLVESLSVLLNLIIREKRVTILFSYRDKHQGN